MNEFLFFLGGVNTMIQARAYTETTKNLHLIGVVLWFMVMIVNARIWISAIKRNLSTPTF